VHVQSHSLYKKDLLQFCHNNNIVFEAYSSLGVGKLLNELVITNIADDISEQFNLKVSSANVLLKWAIQHKAVVLPKSVKKERVEANFLPMLQKWNLSQEQMDKIDALNTNTHLCWDPTNVA